MKYQVTTKQAGLLEVHEIDAYSPGHAGDMAKRMRGIGAEVVTVVCEWRCVGTCQRCEKELYDQDKPRERRGKLICEECP